MLTDRQKAARKGARTRKANIAAWQRYNQVDRPILGMIDALINQHLSCVRINVRFVDRSENGRKLKNGTEFGRLVKVMHGGKVWRVHPLGYARPRDYHASFWSLE